MKQVKGYYDGKRPTKIIAPIFNTITLQKNDLGLGTSQTVMIGLHDRIVNM